MANLDRATFIVAPTLNTPNTMTQRPNFQRPRLSARVFQPPMRGSLPVHRIIQEVVSSKDQESQQSQKKTC